VLLQDVLDALPLAGCFWVTLLMHEAGHRVAASKYSNVSLYLPLIVPAGFGFVGSFGGITRFKVRARLRACCMSRMSLCEMGLQLG
jgi:hypothetical protein